MSRCCKAHREHHIETVGDGFQHEVGDERPDDDTRRVERPVNREAGSQVGRWSVQRDHGIAGSGSHALAGPIDRDHRRQRCGAPRYDEEAELAQRGHPVSDSGHELVPVPAVREQAASKTKHGSHTLIQAIDDAELQR